MDFGVILISSKPEDQWFCHGKHKFLQNRHVHKKTIPKKWQKACRFSNSILFDFCIDLGGSRPPKWETKSLFWFQNLLFWLKNAIFSGFLVLKLLFWLQICFFSRNYRLFGCIKRLFLFIYLFIYIFFFIIY